MLDFLSDIGESIVSGLQTILYNTIWALLYAIDIAFVAITNVVYRLFRVFAGLQTVEYKDGGFTNKDTLINVLLRNGSISSVYWDIAIVGIALCFAFAIIAVIKKMADIYDKDQTTLGRIFFNVGKSILVILLMTAIVTATINFSNVLLSSIDAAFNRATGTEQERSIDFDDEEYAAMARVLNTIGNYSLNTAYSSRYNVNACYNKIRADMQWLESDGVFNFDYYLVDGSGKQVESWQSALLRIYRASGDLRMDVSMDYYDENLSRAIVSVMETIQNNASFKPLTHYERVNRNVDASNTPFDVMLFLSGTSMAANNQAYNEHPSINDSVRGQYITGEKDIYSLSDVMEDFDISPIGTPRMQHLVIILSCYFVFKDLLVCLFNAIARTFNVIMLYLVAPLAISTSPLDDGGKFKQWSTAFVIQAFGLLGNVVAMRLFLLFVPLIFSGNITFFEDGFLNFLAQVLFLVGGADVMKKSSGLITGILADNAGMQSIMAGDMSDTAEKVGGALGSAASTAGGLVADATGVTKLKNDVSEKWGEFAKRGGIFGGFGGGGGGGKDGGGIPPEAGKGNPSDFIGSGGGGGQNNSQMGNQDSGPSNGDTQMGGSDNSGDTAVNLSEGSSGEPQNNSQAGEPDQQPGDGSPTQQTNMANGDFESYQGTSQQEQQEQYSNYSMQGSSD